MAVWLPMAKYCYLLQSRIISLSLFIQFNAYLFHYYQYPLHQPLLHLLETKKRKWNIRNPNIKTVFSVVQSHSFIALLLVVGRPSTNTTIWCVAWNGLPAPQVQIVQWFNCLIGMQFLIWWRRLFTWFQWLIFLPILTKISFRKGGKEILMKNFKRNFLGKCLERFS